jgi:predicted metalloprotease with PDZ domain
VAAAGCYSYGNLLVGVINWNTCLIYPEGRPCTAQSVHLRLRLPPKWEYATALKTETATDGVVMFRTVTLDELLDCPLIGGEHMQHIKLDHGQTPPAFLDLASESPGVLRLDPKVVAMYSRVVREAGALFGAAHYPEYHFLVTCSDELGYFGLEHHACSINGVRERDLVDDEHRRGWVANLLPHEYGHSWCGKFRRPAGMCTTDFHTPQKTRLLWVYEGLTMYLGDLLMVRSGLVSATEYREMLAETLGTMMHREGRRWRSLEDTAVANYLLRVASPNWNDLRRDQDFYPEGMLLWLEADAIIRDLSKNQRSLDNFCKRFMGPLATHDKVVPYEQADVVRALKETADYDWEEFLRRRVAAPLETLPLDVVGRCGYRLRYADKPSKYLERLQQGNLGRTFLGARDSLGLTFAPDGRITNVVPGMVGDRAGLAPGMMVIGVNSRKFSGERLQDALADSIARRKIEFLLLEGDRFRTITLDYADGPKYLELARDPAKPDYLADILAAKAGTSP